MELLYGRALALNVKEPRYNPLVSFGKNGGGDSIQKLRERLTIVIMLTIPS